MPVVFVTTGMYFDYMPRSSIRVGPLALILRSLLMHSDLGPDVPSTV